MHRVGGMDLGRDEARRIALRAQGFGSKNSSVDILTKRLGLIQIDSVNVLVRSHYLPVFSRRGAYDTAVFDALAYAPAKKALFEYWGHEASLIPLEFFPLLRWRMARAAEGNAGWGSVIRFGRENPAVIARALDEVRNRGPIGAGALSEGGKSQGAWWGWSQGKRAMEYLFWTGQVSTAARGNNFERLYDLTERVIPSGFLNAPAPGADAAQRQLILVAAQAMGVATEKDLRDYFRLSVADTKACIAELCEAKSLKPVRVEGWRHQAYLAKGIKQADEIECAALLSPFDNLIWERDRAERLFGTRIKLEIYTPQHQRMHGYYVLPFLLNGRIAARVDLKSDRKAGALLVHAAHLEPGAEPRGTAGALAGALVKLAGWLKLKDVKAAGRGKFDVLLRTSLRTA
jgi:uncharacterized protein